MILLDEGRVPRADLDHLRQVADEAGRTNDPDTYRLLHALLDAADDAESAIEVKAKLAEAEAIAIEEVDERRALELSLRQARADADKAFQEYQDLRDAFDAYRRKRP